MNNFSIQSVGRAGLESHVIIYYVHMFYRLCYIILYMIIYIYTHITGDIWSRLINMKCMNRIEVMEINKMALGEYVE